jgi:hypothetical protein
MLYMNLGVDALTLGLSEGGKEKGWLEAAGGHHWHAVWRIAYEQGQKNIAKHEAQIEILHDKELKGDKAKKTWDANIAKLKEENEIKASFLDVISVWGVVIYDASEC